MPTILQSLFVSFYCLPISDVLILIAVATYVFLGIHRAQKDKLWWKLFVAAVLTAWCAVILFATAAGRETGNHDVPSLIPFHSYLAVMNGASREILRSNFMNVVLFYPAGLMAAVLLPAKWPWWVRILLPLLLFSCLSGGVEYAQYAFGMGCTEIDDVIHNTFGALLGSLLSLLSTRLSK